jgi:hypothetical protein
MREAGFLEKLFGKVYAEKEVKKACNIANAEGYINGLGDMQLNLKNVVENINTEKDNIGIENQKLSELNSNYENVIKHLLNTIKVNFPDLVTSTNLSEVDGKELKDIISIALDRYHNNTICLQNKLDQVYHEVKERDKMIIMLQQKLDKIKACL